MPKKVAAKASKQTEAETPKAAKVVKPKFPAPQCGVRGKWPRLPPLPVLNNRTPRIEQAFCCAVGVGARARDSGWIRLQEDAPRSGPRYALIFPNPAHNARAWLSALNLNEAYCTYALRCVSGTDKAVNGEAYAICRQYLSIDPKCDIAIAVGDRAWYAITGRKTLPRSTGFVHVELANGKRIPVVLVDDDLPANKFAKREGLLRIQKALEREPVELPVPIPHTEVTEQDVMEILQDAPYLAVDVETFGDMPSDEFRIVSMAFAVDGVCWTWKEQEIPDWAIALIQNPDIVKVYHNAVFDTRAILRHFGIRSANNADTLAMRKLLNPDGDGTLDALSEIMGHFSHKWIADVRLAALEQAATLLEKRTAKMQAKSLLSLADKWFDGGEMLVEEMDRLQEIGNIPKEHRAKSHIFAYMPIDLLRDYNAQDAGVTLAAYHFLANVIENGPIADFYKDHVLPALNAVLNMAMTGIPINKAKLEATAMRINDKLEPLVAEFEQTYGCNPFGRKEPLIIAHELGVVPRDSNTLDSKALDSDHPFAKLMKEIRRIKKRLDAALALYFSVWPDGRIRPSFNLTGARTGRLSCSRPNLQNVPKESDEESKWIRECFEAPEGYTLVSADYSQVELIVMASLARDNVALQAIQSGSYHMDTARIVVPIAFGIAPEDVNEKEHKRYGKTANFGWLYGAGDKTTAERFNTTPEIARRMRQQVLGRKFAQTGRYIERTQTEAAQSGVARTYYMGKPARIRPLYDFGSPDNMKKSLAKRQAFNTRIQGSANDVCLTALRRCDEAFQGRDDAEVVLSIHDQIGFLVRDDALFDVVPEIIELMTQDVGFPVGVEAEIGKDWGNMEKYEEPEHEQIH